MTPTDTELFAALPGAVHIRRRPYPYATSCPLTELTIVDHHGGSQRLLLKELRGGLLHPCRKAEPCREADVYRSILGPAGIGPRLVLSGEDWIVIELVDGVELWQVGDVAQWVAVASWLGRHHRAFSGRADDLRLAGLDVIDGAVLGGWLNGAESSVRAVLDVDACRSALYMLAASPPTFVHGEFYPSNVLLAEKRIVPVDWETAAVGPGMLDLAALVTGWDDAAQKRLIDAYGLLDPAMLDRARLALALRWIGWKPERPPPAEHQHDWMGEALGAAERLGL